MTKGTTAKSFFGLNKKDTKSYVKTIIICALLIAITVVLKRVVEIQVPLFGVTKGQSINFSFAIIMFAGFIFGPVWGGIVGVASDLLACLLFPQGAIIIGLMATNFIVGFLAGDFAYVFMKNHRKLIPLAIFCLFISLLTSPLNSFWIITGYGINTPFLVYALPRLGFSVCIMFPINTVLLYIIMNKIVPILEREKLII